MNRVELSGRLTRDPETRFVGARNFPIVSMTVAVDDADGRYNRETKRTEYDSGFYSVEVMGEYGQSVANQLHKGDQVYVIGSMTQWQPPAKDGEEQRSHTRVRGRVVIPLTGMAQPVESEPVREGIPNADFF